jgi:hypothetical protein
MSAAASTSALLSEIELAPVDGRSLEQIDSEVLACYDLNEDSMAAMWLYAWRRGDQASTRRFLTPCSR